MHNYLNVHIKRDTTELLPEMLEGSHIFLPSEEVAEKQGRKG